MRASMVEVRVAGRTDMDHRRHAQFAQYLIKGIPMLVGQRRIGPVSAGWIGIEIDRDKAQLLNYSPELGDAIFRRNTGMLWELSDGCEIVRQQAAHAMDQIIRYDCPFQTSFLASDMMGHTGRPRRENRQVP